jgi:probable rRNA maturation factor
VPPFKPPLLAPRAVSDIAEPGSGRVHITIADGVVPASLEPIAAVAAACLERFGGMRHGQVSIYLCGDVEIQSLNRQFRGIDEPTDVLSFALETDESEALGALVPLGDVVISYERAVAQAQRFGHDPQRELGWLTVHGTLQLLGYVHDDPASEARMRAAEEEILSGRGLARPSS